MTRLPTAGFLFLCWTCLHSSTPDTTSGGLTVPAPVSRALTVFLALCGAHDVPSSFDCSAWHLVNARYKVITISLDPSLFFLLQLHPATLPGQHRSPTLFLLWVLSPRILVPRTLPSKPGCFSSWQGVGVGGWKMSLFHSACSWPCVSTTLPHSL